MMQELKRDKNRTFNAEFGVDDEGEFHLNVYTRNPGFARMLLENLEHVSSEQIRSVCAELHAASTNDFMD